MTTRLHELVDQAVEQATPTIKQIANEVWHLAEISLQEIKSAQLLMDILQEHGELSPEMKHPLELPEWLTEDVVQVK